MRRKDAPVSYVQDRVRDRPRHFRGKSCTTHETDSSYSALSCTERADLAHAKHTVRGLRASAYLPGRGFVPAQWVVVPAVIYVATIVGGENGDSLLQSDVAVNLVRPSVRPSDLILIMCCSKIAHVRPNAELLIGLGNVSQ